MRTFKQFFSEEDGDEDLEVYKDWEHLMAAVGEILGDYGLFEYNMRPPSTVDKGVEEIKELVKFHLKATGKDHNKVYNELDQMNMEAEEQMEGMAHDEEEEEEQHMMNMRLRDMLKAARADMTWKEWVEKYAGEPARGDRMDSPLYQAYLNMVQGLAKEKGLDVPEEFPEPSPDRLLGMDADDYDDDDEPEDPADWWKK